MAGASTTHGVVGRLGVEPLQLLSLKAIDAKALVGRLAVTENESDIDEETERLEKILRFSDRIRSALLTELSAKFDDVGEETRRRIERNALCSFCRKSFPSVRCGYLTNVCKCGGLYICTDCRERFFPGGSRGPCLSVEEKSKFRCPSGCSDAASIATAKAMNAKRPPATLIAVNLDLLLAIDIEPTVTEIADAKSRGELLCVAQSILTHVYARRADLRRPEDDEPCQECGERMPAPASASSPRSVRWLDEQAGGFKACECCKVWLCPSCVKTTERAALCGHCDKLVCARLDMVLIDHGCLPRCGWRESFGQCSEEGCSKRGIVCRDCEKEHSYTFLGRCECGEIADKCPECVSKLGLMKCSDCGWILLCERCANQTSFFGSDKISPYCEECYNRKGHEEYDYYFAARDEEEWRAELEAQEAEEDAERFHAEMEAQEAEEAWRAEMEAQEADEEVERVQAEMEAQDAEEAWRAEMEAQEADEEVERVQAEMEAQEAEEAWRAKMEAQDAEEEVERVQAEMEAQEAEEAWRAKMEAQEADEEVERVQAEMEAREAEEAWRAEMDAQGGG